MALETQPGNTPSGRGSTVPIDRPERGPLNPTKEEMRSRALKKLFDATELVPLQTHSPLSQHCYRSTRLETITSGSTDSASSRDEGNSHEEGGQVFLLLQCGLDFTVVVPVSPSHPLSWCPWRNRLGKTKDGTRLHQHITRTASGVTLQEQSFAVPPRIDTHPDGNGGRHPGWVNNFDLIAEGDLCHLFTNKPDEKAGNTRKYFFGQNPEIWN